MILGPPIYLIVQMATEPVGGSMYSLDPLHKGRIPIPDGTEWDGSRFYYTTQKGVQFKTYELFVSGIFHFILLDHSLPRVTEMVESETKDKGKLLF